MRHYSRTGFGGSILSAGKEAAKAASATAARADKAIKEAQGATRQAREVLTTASRTADDFEIYLKRIRHIPIEELARRFDYKTKIAVEELVSLSSFMKRALLYLGAMATVSIYLNILTRRS